MAQQNAQTLLEQYNKSGALSIDQMLGKTTETPVITGDTLTKTEKPLNVPPPPTPQGSTNLNMAVSTAGTFVKPENTERDSTLSSIRDLIEQTANEPRALLREQEKAGLFTKQEVLTDIENRIASVNREYEKKARTIRKNTEGKFGGAVEQDLRNLQRQSDEQNADLAIIKSAATNDINTALNIANAKIAARFEPLKLQLQGLKDFYALNQDDLSESEKLQLGQQISQQNALFESKIAKDTQFEQGKVALLSSASQQGAPMAVRTAIQNAKTLDEAIIAAGEWGGDILSRRLKQAELNTKIGAIAQIKGESVSADIPTLTDKIASLNAIKESGALNDLVGPAPIARMGFTTDAQSFRAAVNNLASKEALDFLVNLKAKGGTLGALSEKELKILQDSATKLNFWEVKDENGIGTGFWNVKEEDFLAEIDRIEELTNRALTKALGYDPTLVSEEDVLAVQQATGEGSGEFNPENYY